MKHRRQGDELNQGLESKPGDSDKFLWARLSRLWVQERDLLVNGASMVGTTALTSGLGFLFWMLAAHLYSPAAVGLSSTAISAMQLLGTLGTMGLGTLLVRELPHQEAKGPFIMASFLGAGGLAGILGVLFALVAPMVSGEFAPLRAGWDGVALFALGVALTAATFVIDRAFLGLLRGGLQLWRNALFTVGKLGILWIAGTWLSRDNGLTIYGVWAAGNLLSLAIMAGYVGLGKVWKSFIRPGWQVLSGLGLSALKHHALNLSIYAPDWVLPIITTTLFSSQVTAYFYMASMISGFVFAAPNALTEALYAVGAQGPGMLTQKTRLSLKLSLAAGVLGNIALQLAAVFILGLFGGAYVEQATVCLRILLLGVFPITVSTHYLTICRIEGHLGPATKLMATSGILRLILSAIGAALGGLTGLAIGWLLALCIAAAFMAPVVYRVASAGPTEGEVFPAVPSE